MNKPAPYSDKPLLDAKDDLLGVAPLAEDLARKISKLQVADGFVIGLCGAWGSGKTTFINFVLQALDQNPSDEKPLVLNFNPWLFAGHDDLIQRYIIELSRTLKPIRTRCKKVLFWLTNKVGLTSDIPEQLIKFAGSLGSNSAISGAAIFANPALAAKVHMLGSLSKKAHQALSKQPPLAEQKDRICKSLRKSKKKTIVIIDDIDRLAKEEVLSIFRMAKSVADFPNIIYLLSFDRQPVCKIIGEIQDCDGADYLEKIVQYEIDLPEPDPQSVLNIFSARVDPVIETPQSIPFDTERWAKIYMGYIRSFLFTPRQAIRWGNAVCFNYPDLVGEVNPVDFVTIEALRLFHPEVYNQVKRSPHKFVELGQNQFDSEKTDKAFFESVINYAPESERISVQTMLTELFPRMQNAFSNFKTGTYHIHDWRTESRVCSEPHFGRYFNYTASSNKLTNAELKEAIALMEDTQAFSDLLVRYSNQKANNGKTRIPEILERLLDMVKAGKLDQGLENLIRSLIISGDSIFKKEDEERGGFIRINTELRIIWILLGAFERYQGDLYKILEEAYKESVSVDIPSRLIATLGREHGKGRGKAAIDIIRPGQPPYLSLDQVNTLEAITLEKIRASARNKQLLTSIHMHSILWRWRDFTGSFEEPRNWVKKSSRSNSGLVRLVVNFSGISVISDGRGTREEIKFDFNSIQNFLDLDNAYKRVIQLVKNKSVSVDDQPIIEAFIAAYESHSKKDAND